MPEGPLIVQSDHTLLLEIDHVDADQCRYDIARFAELERSPEHIHTYRITPLALWNAMASGFKVEEAFESLKKWTRFPIPQNIFQNLEESMSRFGRLVLEIDEIHGLVLRSNDNAVLEEVIRSKRVMPLLGVRIDKSTVVVSRTERGRLKQELLKIGWPALDLAGFVEGKSYEIELSNLDEWEMRNYQKLAVDTFSAAGDGVVVLPCGSGKTIVGIGAIAKAKTETLILVTNTVALHQWRDELLKRTTLTANDIGEYSGTKKEIKSITIATYQVLIKKKGSLYSHLELFDAKEWGLVLYDEVHLLPAPIFRMTADIQARRRLGLTATLVREDNLEGDVFTLIGPKRYEVPWREIEAQGWIAPAKCFEIRVTLTDEERLAYATAEQNWQYKVAATARSKISVVERICKHSLQMGEFVLVIGGYLDQLDDMVTRLGAPLITGKTPIKVRERLFDDFRNGRENLLIVSKVANFSIDLPDASVAIQISGAFGSRQEEAQRLGRLLRPKPNNAQARFFTVISKDTNDQIFAQKRQRFLTEQGYTYEIYDDDVDLGEIW